MNVLSYLAYRFGYQGQFAEADAETNFNNFELRQYDPVTGRWMTTDPFGQYHSPYLAMGNDPVNSIDPTGGIGLDCIFWAIGGALYEALPYIIANAANVSSTFISVTAQSITAGLTGGIDPPKYQKGINSPEYFYLYEKQKGYSGSSQAAKRNGLWGFWGEGSVPYTGNGVGGTNFIGPGPNKDPFKLGKNPVDEIDRAAQKHDFFYFKAQTGGIKGALIDKIVRSADFILAIQAYSIMLGYRAGRIDEVTSHPISERTFNLATAVYNLFKPISIYKYFSAF